MCATSKFYRDRIEAGPFWRVLLHRYYNTDEQPTHGFHVPIGALEILEQCDPPLFESSSSSYEEVEVYEYGFGMNPMFQPQPVMFQPQPVQFLPQERIRPMPMPAPTEKKTVRRKKVPEVRKTKGVIFPKGTATPPKMAKRGATMNARAGPKPKEEKKESEVKPSAAKNYKSLFMQHSFANRYALFVHLYLFLFLFYYFFIFFIYYFILFFLFFYFFIFYLFCINHCI
jgi:hypothetical protein